MENSLKAMAGLMAGSITVVLVDRFLWPGTMLAGMIGVITAVAVVSLMPRKR